MDSDRQRLLKPGQFMQTEAACGLVLGGYEQALGPDHVWVAAICDAIANAFRKQDCDKEADVYTAAPKPFELPHKE